VKEKDTTSSAAGNRSGRGKQAEEVAARFLERHGLQVLERNFRCRGGEIDLVCRAGKALVFVEVRLRGTRAFGGAGASITPAKQRRIILAARHYLAARAAGECDCRFDCILFDGIGSARESHIEWVRDAFAAD